MINEILNELKEKGLKNMFQNILSLRNFGNKLHGDTLEVGLTTLINEKSSFCCTHVGKEFFRSGLKYDIIISKNKELLDMYVSTLNEYKITKVQELKSLCDKYNLKYENKKDAIILISNHLDKKMIELNKNIQGLSLKCYGKGPLQLDTNSNSSLINECLSHVENKSEETILPLSILKCDSFQELKNDVILSIIYDENSHNYSLTIISIQKLIEKVSKIVYYPESRKNNKIEKYEIVKFYDADDNYLFEVRYGKKDANALQRGLWTKTETEKNPAFDYIIYNENYEVNYDFLSKFANMLIS